MAKLTIEFDYYEDSEEYANAINGTAYKQRFEDIWDEMFRPRHKNGYYVNKMNELLGLDREENEMTESMKACNDQMDLLEAKYQDIKDKDNDRI